MFKKVFLLTIITVAACFSKYAAAQAIADLYKTTESGLGELIGTVVFTDTEEGLKITYDFRNMPAGEHGFHVHENPDCSPMMKDGRMQHALGAGGHYDPDKTDSHLGPDGKGHKGDLPVLVIAEDGTASGFMLISKEKGLMADELRNRSIMIHEGGDNYSDEPVTLGGGGARIACGIIE